MNHYLDQAPGRKISTKEGDFLYFGGTSYLGLQSDPDFLEIFIQNIKRYGTNFGASRKANVRLSVFEEFEQYISHKTGQEDSICMSSGYLAGQMLLQYFSIKNHQLFCAPHTHPALITEESRLFENHEKLQKSIAQSLKLNEQVVLFLDSIDFEGNNFPNFEWLQKFPLEEIILVVDDSHGLGLIGDDGFGLTSILKAFHPKDLIICGSLGKALATPCGIISGTKERMEDLRNCGFYGGGSPPSPAALKTLIASETVVLKNLKKLRDHINLFNSEVSDEFKSTHFNQHPVFTYDDEKLTRYLYSEKIITTNFHYPFPESPLLSKIVLSAGHSTEDILNLAGSINRFYS